ncbi:MAG: prolyl oligopeptidase family serine peptidase [Bdellovibrionaceae bacterium]|nr:prolyl oligopeptidase family serine peptidase [Pseudobdellovibrionaceae bacterium]
MKRTIVTEDCPFRNSTFFVPNDGESHPGIILLHGAEGGGSPFWKGSALMYAANGFATLAYCYFGRNDSLWGPRETLVNFDLEELDEALTWLKLSSFVKDQKVALAGASRGAELALLYASLTANEKIFTQPDCISVHCPSDETYGSWNLDWEDDRCWIKKEPQNPPRGSHPGPSSVWNEKCGLDPRKLPDHMKTAWKWKGQAIPANFRIPVENIEVPVFISHGLNDDVWSVEKTKKIEASMRSANKMPEVHYFEGEGHNLGRLAGGKRMESVLDFLSKNLI